MLLRSKFRRSRLTLLFACLIILTAIAYALLNSFTVRAAYNEQEQRGITNIAELDVVVINSSSSISSRPSTERPLSIASLKLVRKSAVQETAESNASYSVPGDGSLSGDNVTEADTGMETKGKLIRHGEAEQRVRREVTRLRLRPPKTVQYSHGQWQIVDMGRQVYVYSAFYDNRPDIDWPQVRIIAVAESDVHLYGLCCLLWYHSQRLPDVAEISFSIIGPKISPHGQTILEQFIFSCRLDRNKTDAPKSVSLVAPHNFRLSNLLPVQVPERPKRVIEFGHCMSILYWKQEPLRFVEWLEAHRMWGVGEINVYWTAVDNITAGILRRYSETGFVKQWESPGPLGDDNEYAILLSMSPVINDCMYRNMYRYRYVVCTDLDELIVPASPHQSYSEMLTAAAAVATRANAIVHSYLFRNTYFFLDFGATETAPWYLLTQRYTKCVRPSRYGYSSKSITRTLSCVGLQNHLCWQSLPSYIGQPNWNVDVPADIGKSQHYKKCHFDKFLQKNGVCHRMMTSDDVTNDRTMVRFRDELAHVVADKLLELDLVEVAADDSWKKYQRVP